MNNLQLQLAVGLPTTAVLASMVVSLVQISGIRDDNSWQSTMPDKRLTPSEHGARIAAVRWAKATEADREASRKNGRLGGRPVCACKECKACARRAKG